MTEELIDTLASDLRPTGRGGVALRIALGLSAGFMVAAAGVFWLLGPRRDMAEAVRSEMFWVKLAYTGAVAVLGALGVERAARPGGRPWVRLAWTAVPVSLIATLAAAQLLRSSPEGWRPLVMGGSAAVCPWLIALSSAPLLLTLFWVVRGLAPTRLRIAGALAGLTAGGGAALAYCLHCAESGAPFVAIWYSLGILLPCVIGALLGPWLLRWR